MESELAACPICGAKILPSVVPMYDDGSAASTASCFNGKCLYRVRREDHNTLARRAEIGALVEEIVENIEYIPDDGRLFVGHGGLSVGIEDDFGEHRHVAGTSLLDALRALAAELGVSDE